MSGLVIGTSTRHPDDEGDDDEGDDDDIRAHRAVVQPRAATNQEGRPSYPR